MYIYFRGGSRIFKREQGKHGDLTLRLLKLNTNVQYLCDRGGSEHPDVPRICLVFHFEIADFCVTSFYLSVYKIRVAQFSFFNSKSHTLSFGGVS